MVHLSALAAYAFEHPILFAFYSLTLSTTAYALLWLYRIFLAPSFFSPLRQVPGPKPVHPLWGNLKKVLDLPPGVAYRQWTDEYGGAVRFRHVLGEDRLLITDPVALNHVLNQNIDSYPKPPTLLGDINMLLDGGLSAVSGDVHRRQRRLMAPAFAPSVMKALVPVFFELSYNLRDIIRSRIDTGTVEVVAWPSKPAALAYAETEREGEAVVEMSELITCTALDALGKSAFDYDFNRLAMKRNKLAETLASLFSPKSFPGHLHPAGFFLAAQSLRLVRRLYRNDWLKYIPTAPTTFLQGALSSFDEEITKILVDKTEKKPEEEEGDGAVKKKDLLSIFNTPAAQDSMTHDELRAQMKTFVFAGHDTVATIMTWTLWWLAETPVKQERVRKEIRAARRKALAEGREELSADEVASLPYLDAILREVLRLEPTSTDIPRVATRDDLIPLSTPVPSALNPTQLLSHVPVKKGQYIEIGISAANRNKDVYGEDVDAFRPERWLSEESEKKIEGKVGVYSGIMTFLSGQRACIGYKFALYQMKAVLSVLLDEFDFSPRDPSIVFERRMQMISRPFVIGEEGLGSRIPLKVRVAGEIEEEE